MEEDHLPRTSQTPDPKGFALSGKIMLSAIIILFFVVVLMVSLHLYAKWYLLRERRRQLLLRRRNRLNNNPRRAHIVFYVDSNNPASLMVPDDANRGLEPAVVSSLPVFVYSSKTKPEAQPEGLECAVCLSEFEDGEKGRLLPKCNHSFHIDCIDMWFHSHSTCPICRALVEPVIVPVRTSSVVEPGSISGLYSGCQQEEEEGDSSTASLGSRRKRLDLTAVRIEVPVRSELESELQMSSPASRGFRSPGTRLLTLKRILSMGRKTPTGTSSTTPCGAGTSCNSAATELDLESGPNELTRPLTPRSCEG
ncbi:hypothetical protein ACH5RR_031082 [Cinchona calisaya]|uniref:RING-type E3 ubiquitin transferase n=1 Tax=Cinchona calisaya TaxID=153742 RepID=A0ABD2YEB7_9GENT